MAHEALIAFIRNDLAAQMQALSAPLGHRVRLGDPRLLSRTTDNLAQDLNQEMILTAAAVSGRVNGIWSMLIPLDQAQLIANVAMQEPRDKHQTGDHLADNHRKIIEDITRRVFEGLERRLKKRFGQACFFEVKSVQQIHANRLSQIFPVKQLHFLVLDFDIATFHPGVVMYAFDDQALEDLEEALSDPANDDNKNAHDLLLVDDSPAMIALIKSYLVEAGFSVKVTQSAVETEDFFLSDATVQGMVCDAALGSAHARSLMQWLRTRPSTKKLPVLFTLSDSGRESFEFSRACGASASIVLPASPGEFKQTLKK